MQGKALIFEAYLPAYGACYDKFPLSAFVWRTDIVESEQLPLGEIELGCLLIRHTDMDQANAS